MQPLKRQDDGLVKTLLSKVISYELFMFLLLFYHNSKCVLSVQLFDIGNMYQFEKKAFQITKSNLNEINE